MLLRRLNVPSGFRWTPQSLAKIRQNFTFLEVFVLKRGSSGSREPFVMSHEACPYNHAESLTFFTLYLHLCC